MSLLGAYVWKFYFNNNIETQASHENTSSHCAMPTNNPPSQPAPINNNLPVKQDEINQALKSTKVLIKRDQKSYNNTVDSVTVSAASNASKTLLINQEQNIAASSDQEADPSQTPRHPEITIQIPTKDGVVIYDRDEDQRVIEVQQDDESPDQSLPFTTAKPHEPVSNELIVVETGDFTFDSPEVSDEKKQPEQTEDSCHATSPKSTSTKSQSDSEQELDQDDPEQQPDEEDEPVPAGNDMETSYIVIEPTEEDQQISDHINSGETELQTKTQNEEDFDHEEDSQGFAIVHKNGSSTYSDPPLSPQDDKQTTFITDDKNLDQDLYIRVYSPFSNHENSPSALDAPTNVITAVDSTPSPTPSNTSQPSIPRSSSDEDFIMIESARQ